MISPFEKKLALFFSFILFAIIAMGIVTFRNNKSIHDTEYWVQHTRQVLFQSEELKSSIQGVVLNTRGYIITGDTSFIQLNLKAKTKIDEHINNLKNLTKDNPSQYLRTDTLAKLINRRIEFSHLTIESRRLNGLSAVQQLIATGKGEQLLNEIQNIIDRIQLSENDLLAIRQQAYNKRFGVFNRSFFFFLVIIIVLLISAFFIIRRNTIMRIRSVAALKKSNELFSHLFNNNPGSITISRLSDAKILNVNDAFLSLFKFTDKEEVIGKTARELNIVAQPEQREELAELLKKNKIIKDFEIKTYTKQGDVFWISTSILIIVIDGEPCLFSISVDISNRKKTEVELMMVNKELESFTYSVSHDLRAPLRMINGYTDILANEYNHVLDNEGKRLTGIITKNAKRMGNLIDDMLEFSQLGKTELNKQPVDMNKLVTSIIEEQLLTNKNGKPEIKIENLPVANCDHNLVRQVWHNLISNALKYSSKKENAIIEIGSLSKPGELIYFIKDNGAGFDIQYADKLFGVFQRLHNLSEFEGTGVGLAIVHRIVTRHGGRVWAKAETDKGATFYFSLPS